MKKDFVLRTALAAAVVLGTGVPASALVYPWNIPANVRIVQKDSVNARTFTTVKAALDSLTGCTAAKRCVVKVMPGTYAIPAGGLVLKPFVDVEGSGIGVTIISGSVAAGRALWTVLPADQSAVVRMAPNSRLLDLTVRNNTSAGGVGVFFNETPNAGLERVSVEVNGANGTSGSYGYDYHAIHAQGSSSVVTLVGVTARNQISYTPATTLYGESTAIGMWDGKLAVKDSSASTVNGIYEVGIAAMGGGSLSVRESSIEVGGESGEARGIYGGASVNDVCETTVKVTCSSTPADGCAGVFGNPGMVVRSSDISVDTEPGWTNYGVLRGQGFISNSLLRGEDATNSWKTVHCSDENFDPVP